MALVKFGPAVANASGSIGGTVFSHNRGGSYIRTRVVPVKVENMFTMAARDAMATVSRLWAGLTADQREAWREYSTAVPSINRLGESKTLGGHVAFNKINARLIQQGAATLDLPPVLGPPDPLSTLSVDVDVSDGTADVTFAPTPLPANTALWLWCAPVPSAGVNYVANRWRLVYKSAAAAATGMDIQGNLNDRFGSIQAGQVLYFRGQTISTVTGLVSGFVSTVSVAQA
jgi:hypothetical protein